MSPVVSAPAGTAAGVPSANVPSALLGDAQPVYLYDGTLEGMLTAVFEAFRRKEVPLEIAQEDGLQQSLMCSYIPILTDVAKAERVRNGVSGTLGERTYENLKRVFLSDDGRKGGVIVRYLLYTMRKGRRACSHLANPAVASFEELLGKVAKEAHYMLQFVRFAQLENGVYFSRIEPQASVVPLIMGHFAARFNVQPFMIYDARHGLSGVFDTERWWLVDARDVQEPPPSRAQDGFQALWQTFYDTIAREERRNPVCQRNFMPKRFWGNLCEQIPPQLRNLRPQTTTPTEAARLGTARLGTRPDTRRLPA
ncbi:MAG: TIGR03915 family putative DNA repair protein [Coriobacteriales bacterium]|jgi:probable DNA metabolism protein|nr:TIGR03915 family putative DNA repair protein [Coriobacteriales bacterium]